MAKSNMKCVRLEDEILKIVEKVNGNGFNEKFENLVIEYHKSIPEREKYLKNLNAQIDSKLKDLEKIEERIRGLKNLEFSLDSLRNDILRITESASKIIDVSQIRSDIPSEPELKEPVNKKIHFKYK